MRFTQFATVALVLLFLTTLSRADWGHCPRIGVKKDFNLKKYYGVWYEIARFKDTPFEQDLFCVRVNYTTGIHEESHMRVINFGRRGGKRGDPVEAPYDAFIPDEREPAKMKINLTSSYQSDYWVIDTDYDHYAVILSCREVLGIWHRIYVWILSRKPKIDQKVLHRLLDMLREHKVPVDRFMYTPQEGCWPSSDFTPPVILNQ